MHIFTPNRKYQIFIPIKYMVLNILDGCSVTYGARRHTMVTKAKAFICTKGDHKMNCLCNLFDDSTVWVIIIALIILFSCCNNQNSIRGGCGCGCGC